MSKSKVPASLWMAEQFLASCRLVAFQEDDAVYQPASGLYEKPERVWLAHEVAIFLANSLGSSRVEARYVADVSRSVRDLAFLDGRRNPPFWVESKEPADVIVAANGIVDLGPLFAGGQAQ